MRTGSVLPTSGTPGSGAKAIRLARLPLPPASVPPARFPLLLPLLLLVPAAHASGPGAAIDIPRLSAGIEVDGSVAEAAWQDAATISLAYEIRPGDNTTPPARTTMRIGHTDDALYLAFIAHDPDPARIRAHLTDRDDAFNDDFVGVMLDTFDDNRRNYEFFVNPLGVQMDLIREESSGNEDASWDGLWSSAGRMTADGYEVEIRIPFSTLRFRDTDGARRWGVIAYRNYPRNVRHQFSGFASFIGLAKFLFSFSGLDGAGMTIANAGLTKGPFTDWWRLLTAPFLHGHWLHWLMNASALAYLGKRVETFARWPHLVMVFAISAWIGGEASLRFSPTTPSVGASGGLMGLLGFLLVFETLHRRLVPESSRRRLLAGVLLTGVIGFVFRHFIDNAAHLGGLVAGMVYAALVFPRSSSPHRPRATTTDVLCGGAALGLVVSAAILACIKMA